MVSSHFLCMDRFSSIELPIRPNYSTSLVLGSMSTWCFSLSSRSQDFIDGLHMTLRYIARRDTAHSAIRIIFAIQRIGWLGGHLSVVSFIFHKALNTCKVCVRGKSTP